MQPPQTAPAPQKQPVAKTASQAASGSRTQQSTPGVPANTATGRSTSAPQKKQDTPTTGASSSSKAPDLAVEAFYPPDETPDDHLDSMRDTYLRHSKGTAALEVSAIRVLGTNLVAKMDPREAEIMKKLKSEPLVITPDIVRALAMKYPPVRVPLIPTTQY